MVLNTDVDSSWKTSVETAKETTRPVYGKWWEWILNDFNGSNLSRLENNFLTNEFLIDLDFNAPLEFISLTIGHYLVRAENKYKGESER